MQQPFENPDDCCPPDGICGNTGLCGTEGPDPELQIDCVSIAYSQIRTVAQFDNSGQCIGNCCAIPFVLAGNLILAIGGTGCLAGAILCTPLVLVCSENRQDIDDHLQCITKNGIFTLRAWTALASAGIAPAFLTVRALRTVTPSFEWSMPNNNIMPNSNLNAPQINAGYGPPIPNDIMPNPHLNPSQINPPARDIISENEFISKLKKLQTEIEEKGRISEKEFLTPFKNLIAYKKSKVSWTIKNSKDLTLALLDLFSTALSPYSKIPASNELPAFVNGNEGLSSDNRLVETCVFSASVIQKAIKAIDFIKRPNPEILKEIETLNILKRKKEEEVMLRGEISKLRKDIACYQIFVNQIDSIIEKNSKGLYPLFENQDENERIKRKILINLNYLKRQLRKVDEVYENKFFKNHFIMKNIYSERDLCHDFDGLINIQEYMRWIKEKNRTLNPHLSSEISLKEEISKLIDEKSQITNPSLLDEVNKFQNILEKKNKKIESLEKSIEEFQFQFKKSLTLSILDYFVRPQNNKQDFKNILTLFLFMPNPLESNLYCIILSCLKGYLSNNPNLCMGLFQRDIVDDAVIKLEREEFNQLLIKHLNPSEVQIREKDPLVNLVEKEFLSVIQKKFFPSSESQLFSFFNKQPQNHISINIKDKKETDVIIPINNI